jgi:ribosomal protein S18 acetylase RimI-like enzyme
VHGTGSHSTGAHDTGAHSEGDARQARVRRRQPGFALAEARHGGFLVGYAAGMPPDLTDEHPGRTFALTDLLVRAPWRRQGIGRELHDQLLRGRPEERATLVVAPGAGAAQQALRSWGWRKVARTRGSGTVLDVPVLDVPVLDVLVLSLDGAR